MKTATSTAMRTHIAQQVTTLARCWKIVRTDGTIFRFTSFNQDLTIGGDGTYSSTFGFQNTAISSKADFSVDNLEVLGVFDSTTITIEDLRAGLFDFADLYLFLVNWQDTTEGPLNLRRGKLGEVIASPQGWFNVEVRGMTQLLQQQIVELYQPTCRADLFDSRCTNGGATTTAAYLCTGHVTAVADQADITIHLDTTPSSPFYESNDGWFQYGVLQFTSGQNDGRALEVKAWDNVANTIQFYVPAGYLPAVNDTFNIIPGCDKSRATCVAKFNNVLNMRAEPDLPGNDQVFNYPDVGGGAG